MKKLVMKFTDESSVTFQSSVSGPGEFGLGQVLHLVFNLEQHTLQMQTHCGLPKLQWLQTPDRRLNRWHIFTISKLSGQLAAVVCCVVHFNLPVIVIDVLKGFIAPQNFLFFGKIFESDRSHQIESFLFFYFIFLHTTPHLFQNMDSQSSVFYIM